MKNRTVTVSTISVLAWVLWVKAAAICVAGMFIVLVWGEKIWARAVGLSLFGAELIIVAGAAVCTIRCYLRRHDKNTLEYIELGNDVRERVRRMR